MIKKGLKWTKRFVLFGFLFVAIYVFFALVFSVIPVNNSNTKENKNIEIYILSNGVHTDLVLPMKNNTHNWYNFLNLAKTKSKDSIANYASFGWGDKGFYIETPNWEDLKVKTAFKALFYLSSSAMHVTFYNQLKENEHCKKIKVSETEYLKLVDYIQSNFDYEDGKPIEITSTTYGDRDVFFEAKGKYSLFYTCNTWSNEGLKSAGLKAALWTPLDKGIFYHY